jgi:ubiquinone/menaquinone biosynthesis C-methylase UbiE
MKESPYLDPAMVVIYERIAARFHFAAPASDLVKIVGVPEGGMVLDVGTGTGVVAAAAGAAVGLSGTVVGTDAAFEMIRLARNKTPNVVVAHVPGLPYSDETFDVVIAGCVVSHFHDYAQGLQDMVRVCRIGGRVGMTVWGSVPNPAANLWSDIATQYAGREQLNEAFLKHIPWEAWFSRIENVAQALSEAGLSSVFTKTTFYKVRMPSNDYLLSREASMQGLVLRRRLTSEQWDDFTIAVAEVFQNKFGDWVEYQRDAHFGVGTKQ